MLRRWIACLLLLFVTAFSLAEDQPYPPGVFPAVRMASGEGMVMLRIIQSRAINEFFYKLSNLYVHHLQSGKTFQVAERYYGGGYPAYYVGSLPPGDYEPTTIKQDMGFAVRVSAAADFPDGFRFRIEPGRLTDLGTIYYLRPYAPSQTAVFRMIHAGDRNLAVRASFMFAPDQVNSLLAAPLGWTSIAPVAHPALLTTSVKQMSMAMAGSFAKDGSSLFGEMFGQVARRGGDGSWTWEDTGITESLMAAVETPDGTRYAVAENSTLLKRDADGRWQGIEVPLAGALPCMISTEADGSLLMAWEVFRRIVVYSYQPRDAAPWHERYSVVYDNWSGLPGSLCIGLTGTPRFMFAKRTMTFTAPQFELYAFDREAGNWITPKPIKATNGIGVFPDGALYTLAPAIKPKFKVSRDFGKTWERRTAQVLSGMPVFRDAKEGYYLHLDSRPIYNMSKLLTSLWRTIDGGKTWKEHAKLPTMVVRLNLLEGQQMLLMTGEGKVYFSPDNGATLTLERDSSAPEW